MTDSANDARVHEIGGKILADPVYADQNWDGLAIVGTYSDGQRRMTAFSFMADGSHRPALPDDLDSAILHGLAELRQAMAAETGTEWHQCLIHIWKPGPKIRIHFEYEDPERWRPKVKGLDISDFIEAIRPPIETTLIQ